MKRFTEILDGALAKREPVVLCTIVETAGSTPLKKGAKMLVRENGEIDGTIGGGNLEKQVVADALALLSAGETMLKEYHLLQQQMCCGGTVKIFLEPFRPQKQLLIFGAGHIGNHLSCFADRLDFRTSIIDERPDMMEKIGGDGTIRLTMHHRLAFKRINFDKYTYIVICTHLHAYDREILAHCINQPHAYLGMIGSRRKIAVTRKLFLKQQTATLLQLDRVDMPIGMDIGAQSPAEIALGIIANIVAISNGKKIIPADKSKEKLITDELLSDCGIQ